VILKVDPTSDPIEGIARDELGEEQPFSGWVGLATALEHALNIGAPSNTVRRDASATEVTLTDPAEGGEISG
jgi:hypothetical protein